MYPVKFELDNFSRSITSLPVGQGNHMTDNGPP